MTNKNFYDDDELFEVDEDETVTIPDFVEDRITTEDTATDTDTNSSMTDSSSVDMTLFKMSDDELYGDDGGNNTEIDREPNKKGSGLTLVLTILLCTLLLLTAAAAIFYALKQRSAYQDANTKYLQLQANQEAFQKQLAEKDAMIEDLNRQIEELQKKKEEGTEYVIVDGPITFRLTPSVDGESTTFEGKSSAENGDTYKVLEVIEDKNDVGRKWAKVADDVYFCIGYLDSVWAKESN